MNDGNLQAIDQTGQFLGDSEALELRVLYVKEKCYWIEEMMQVRAEAACQII